LQSRQLFPAADVGKNQRQPNQENGYDHSALQGIISRNTGTRGFSRVGLNPHR
jgi:hypothetical protein